MNRSGRSPKISEWANRSFFWANYSFAHLFAKKWAIRSENWGANSQPCLIGTVLYCIALGICGPYQLSKQLSPWYFKANDFFKLQNVRKIFLESKQIAKEHHFLWENYPKRYKTGLKVSTVLRSLTPLCNWHRRVRMIFKLKIAEKYLEKLESYKK